MENEIDIVVGSTTFVVGYYVPWRAWAVRLTREGGRQIRWRTRYPSLMDAFKAVARTL